MDLQEFMLHHGKENLVSALRNIQDSSFGEITGGEDLERALDLGNLELGFSGRDVAGYLSYFLFHQCDPSSKRDLRNYLGAISDLGIRQLLEESYDGVKFFDNEFTRQNARVEKNDVYVPSVAVHPTFRGNGVGKKLVAKGIEKAESLGAKKVYLNCWCGHLYAERLYLGLGFFPILKIQGMFPDGSAGIFMGLDLQKK